MGGTRNYNDIYAFEKYDRLDFGKLYLLALRITMVASTSETIIASISEVYDC